MQKANEITISAETNTLYRLNPNLDDEIIYSTRQLLKVKNVQTCYLDILKRCGISVM